MSKLLRNKILIFFLIIVILISIPLFIAGCSEKMTRYDNFTFMVSIEYPDNWKAVESDYLVGGKPTRFEGDSGFLQIAAVNGQDIPIDKVASDEAKNKLNLYGSNPQIEKTNINNRDAVFIFASSDQPEEMNNQACLIIKYPQSLIIDNEEYNYFILWADKKHIKDIANSLHFIVY
jgi:TolB protein